jgi:hypothetical protein
MDFGAGMTTLNNTHIGKILDSSVKAFMDKQKAETMKPDLAQEPSEDLNILPLPVSQEIVPGKWIRWSWGKPAHMEVIVTLYLSRYENEFQAGDFNIELICDAPSTQFEFSPEDAKSLGQDIVSASNWRNVWKQHVGTLIEREVGVWSK